MIRIKFHSVVDVITNSSTVIYTYQNSVKQAKELVEEMLKLAGIADKTPEDIFHYGVFCDEDIYLESDDLPEDCPENEQIEQWLKDLQLSVMKGEIEKPEWMTDYEDGDEGDPDTYLCLVPKDEKYNEFGEKITALLSSVTTEG